MAAKNDMPEDERRRLICDYAAGSKTYEEARKEAGISTRTMGIWIKLYGPKGFNSRRGRPRSAKGSTTESRARVRSTSRSREAGGSVEETPDESPSAEVDVVGLIEAASLRYRYGRIVETTIRLNEQDDWSLLEQLEADVASIRSGMEARSA